MTNALRTAIAALAATFAAGVTAAIKGGRLDDILALTSGDATAPASRAASHPRPAARRTRASGVGKSRAKRAAPAVAPAPAKRAPAPVPKAKPGPLARRSAEDIEKVLELVVALLKSTKDGLRSEQIRDHLGVRKEELPRVLKHGLTTKTLRSKGLKRSTVYSAT